MYENNNNICNYICDTKIFFESLLWMFAFFLLSFLSTFFFNLLFSYWTRIIYNIEYKVKPV